LSGKLSPRVREHEFLTGAETECQAKFPSHDDYERVAGYRDLTAADEQALLDRHMNRVIDTCIPEGEAMRRIEAVAAEERIAADKAGTPFFPHEFMYNTIYSKL
jgi:deoxyhypusine synthase